LEWITGCDDDTGRCGAQPADVITAGWPPSAAPHWAKVGHGQPDPQQRTGTPKKFSKKIGVAPNLKEQSEIRLLRKKIRVLI